MNDEIGDPDVLRHYLLGILEDDVVLSRLEMRLLTNEEFADEISVAEYSLIEEYLDGEMSVEDSSRFEQHFLAAPERKRQLSLTQNLWKYAAKTETVAQPKRSFLDRFPLLSIQWLRFAALAVVVTGAGFIVWRFAIYQSDADKSLGQLRQAYKGQRPLEPRITALPDYVPYSETRGPAQNAPDPDALRRAEVYLLEATQNPGDAKAHHAQGLIDLAQKKYDAAIREFDLALAASPNDAKLHTDMGAAQFEKSKQADLAGQPGASLKNLALSLQSLNRALELDNSLPEALFDKALVLQKMQLPNQAKQAWQQYLEKDASSPWADEARGNFELLKKQEGQTKDSSQVLKDFLDAADRHDEQKGWEIASQTKEMVTGVMLAPQLTEKFLKADADGSDAEANTFLAAFVFLGQLERQNSGDPYFAELAHFYENTEPQQRQKLREAHNELQHGNELILKTNFPEALEALSRAKELFLSAKSQWEAQLVEHRICYCLSQFNKIRESNERLASVSNFARERDYKWLETLAEGWIGSNYSVLGEHSKAVTHDQKGLELAKEIGDTYDIQKVGSQITNEYWLIGDADRTLEFIQLSLNVPTPYFLSSRQKSRNLLFGTEGLYRFKFYDAAAAFGREEIGVARDELKDKWLSHTALTHLAAIYAYQNQYPKAFEAVDASFQLANSFGDAVMRQKLDTRSRLILANLLNQSGNLDEAVKNYDRVIEDYGNSDFSINKYEARKGRLLCLVGQKNDSAVKAEMPELLRMFDQNRQTISTESDRNTFFDNEQSVYDIAVDYAYTELKDPEQAFNYAENSRARSLLSKIQKNVPEPLVLSDFRQSIPADLQVVYYAVAAGKLLIWHISKTNFSVAEERINERDLNERVQKYVKLITDKKDSRDASKNLFGLLIQPIEHILEPDKSLCIIADKALFRIPFASLVSPRTDRYFIEDYKLLFAPSVSVLIYETAVARTKSIDRGETILSIGNPLFSHDEYPDLPDLPAAAREAIEIGKFYDSAKIFIGKDADSKRIVSSLNGSDVVHFASHYVSNASIPGISKFLVAPKDLTVDELAQISLSRVRLLTLSACDTGFEKYLKGEGMIGVARTFLSLDVPVVVASQWPVDSDATAELMIKFHRSRKQGKLPTTAALQQAQIEMLKGENPRFREPFYWASFMPIGGYTDY